MMLSWMLEDELYSEEAVGGENGEWKEKDERG